MIKKYELDPNSIFSQEGEVLITRTNLPAKEMLSLLQKGFLYVSDFLEYYNIFNNTTNDSEKEPSILNEYGDAFHALIPYSTPFMKLDVSDELMQVLKDRRIFTFENMKEEQNNFSDGFKEKIDRLIKDISGMYDAVSHPEYECYNNKNKTKDT